MIEQIISFETAKLAKMRGMLEPSHNWYNFSGLLICNFPDVMYPSNDLKFPSYSASTQSLLQKWLRDEHDINVISIPERLASKNLYYWYMVLQGDKEINDWQTRFSNILKKSEQNIEGNHVNEDLFEKYLYEDKFAFKTYEEALEAGLFEALKLIKNEKE